MSALRVIPLGGLGEVGLNCLLLEQGGRRVMIDCGLLFPRPDAPGAALAVPDFSYLRRSGGLDAVLLTHGHEDHVGALPLLLSEFPVPVYGTRLTLALVREKLLEHGLRVPLVEVAPGGPFEAGPFIAEPLRVSHSIPHGVGFAVETDAGVVVHTGDWKLDLRPGGDAEERLDVDRFAALGRAGVAALLSDSTNAERPGWSVSESTVAEGLHRQLRSLPGRAVVALFASHLVRVRNLMAMAAALGRRVVLQGRALERNVTLGVEAGVLTIPPGLLASAEEAAGLPPNELLILCTGAQGEPGSALWRLAAGTALPLRLDAGDTVLLSARTIPGNELPVAQLCDRLSRHGVRVIDRGEPPIHASGHAHVDEQRMMLELVRPRGFVPIHGEHRMLMAHARTALGMGLAASEVFVLEDGDALELSADGGRLGDTVAAGPVWMESRLGPASQPELLQARQQAGRDGVVQLLLGVDALGTARIGPSLSSRGVAGLEPGTPLHRAVLDEVRAELARPATPGRRPEASLPTPLSEAVSRVLRRETGRRPLVLCTVVALP